MIAAEWLTRYLPGFAVGAAWTIVMFGVGYLVCRRTRMQYVDHLVEREVERRSHELVRQRDVALARCETASIALKACAVQVGDLSTLTDHEVKIVMVSNGHEGDKG